MPATFTVGTTYVERWIGQSDLQPLLTVVARTARFITVEDSDGRRKRVGVKVSSDGGEYALVRGSYSMAPVLRADRPVVTA